MPTLKEQRARRPGNRENIDRIKGTMREETKHYRLRAFREEAGLTQSLLAEQVGVKQNRISQIEHGDIDRSTVSTLRKYVQALGGDLEINIKRPNGERLTLDIGADVDRATDERT